MTTTTDASAPPSLTEVAGKQLNLLSSMATPLYVSAACLTDGFIRWFSILMTVLLVATALTRRKQTSAAEAPIALLFCAVANAVWGWSSTEVPLLATAALVLAAVYAALMLPRTYARIAVIALPLAALTAQFARGFSGDLALQTLALAAADVALGLLLLFTRVTLERNIAEDRRAMSAMVTRLEQLSRADALTGLANRRRLDEALTDAWADAAGKANALSVIMIDVDHFKLYNDHYGHLGGDACLKKIADTLAASVRNTDMVARCGGEEFLVIAPGADPHLAVQIAERLRRNVESLHLEHAAVPCGYVSVSVGVTTTVPAPDGHVESLVKQADQALYQAKRNGRNQFAVA